MIEYNERLAEMLKAIGHPVRLLIVKGLYSRRCNVNKMVKNLGIPQATVSQHLRVLKAAGVVRGERKGVEICYRIDDPLVGKILKCI
jgi:ArsR family transcriptional regulator